MQFLEKIKKNFNKNLYNKRFLNFFNSFIFIIFLFNFIFIKSGSIFEMVEDDINLIENLNENINLKEDTISNNKDYFFKNDMPNEKLKGLNDSVNVSILDDYTEPWKIFEDEGAILLNFSNADFINVIKYYESVYKVIFITDDVLQPVSQLGKSLIGSKINFTSNRPLSRKDAWNVLITLLEISGLTLQPGAMKRVYRVVPLDKASPVGYVKGPLPTYIGIDPENLTQGDMRIRYVYQVKNTSMEAVKSIIMTMQSPASPEPIEIRELNGIMITDRVFNIKTIIAVIKEIDKVTMPESMSIIKLEKLDAIKFTDLYKTILKEEFNGNPQPRIVGTSRRSEALNYFDAQLRVIPESRTNSLIVLGSIESIKKFENFVKEYEEKSVKQSYIPIHTYVLKYTQAESIASLLTQAIGFKSETEIGKVGGVKGGEKYFSQTNIIAEPVTNTLIIMSPDEEYKHIYDILNKIDVPQKQVSFDIVMLSVDIGKAKNLGAQIRNSPGTLGNINFQTGVMNSNIGIVPSYKMEGTSGGNANQTGVNGTNRLLGNLLKLVVGEDGSAVGTSVVTLGSDSYGVWGIIKFLMTETQAKIMQNPFILVSNKYEAVMNVGETRRIADSLITTNNNEGNSFKSDTATLELKITPQITDDGKILINVSISSSQFTGPENDPVKSGNKVTRSVQTSTMVGDGEMIALGGLTQDVISENQREVPWFARIPLIGWLFKNKTTESTKSVLIIFIQPKILQNEEDVNKDLEKRYGDLKKNMIMEGLDKYCPIQRFYFGEDKSPYKTSTVYSSFWKGNEALNPLDDDKNKNIKSKKKVEIKNA